MPLTRGGRAPDARCPERALLADSAARAAGLRLLPIEPSTPPYPPRLREQGVTGQVALEFVVDTTGRPVRCTAHVLRSTHGEFTAAVLDHLPALRFEPATEAGRKVPAVVTGYSARFDIEGGSPFGWRPYP